jgi:hypothetical protein
LLVPRGADVSDFATEFQSPTLTGITIICYGNTSLRCPYGFLARTCFHALPI